HQIDVTRTLVTFSAQQFWCYHPAVSALHETKTVAFMAITSELRIGRAVLSLRGYLEAQHYLDTGLSSFDSCWFCERTGPKWSTIC
ncbi:MAG TPA: hypothetical protein VFK47_01625, partial [Ktedonobacteraceae bacterium]|nr:hypothetical protein [Ktedonobacteraceae bacterium]